MFILFFFLFFFFNDTATTEIYTSFPTRRSSDLADEAALCLGVPRHGLDLLPHRDRKSTRLNSSHGYISYAVFCLKKKKNQIIHMQNLKKKNTIKKGKNDIA